MVAYVKPSKASGISRPAGSIKKTAGQKARIPVWIIDDNKSFCVLLAEALNSSKSVRCVYYFHSLRAMLRELDRTKLRPSVVLLDIKMPLQNGLESIVPIKKASPNTLVIMLTSYDDENEIQTALDRGASGYLLKTSTPEEIIHAVERAMQGGSPLDPMITKKIMSLLAVTKKDSHLPGKLTRREKEVVTLISKGLATERIAHELSLSYYTIDTHLKNIYRKLDVHSRHTLIAKVYDEGFVK